MNASTMARLELLHPRVKLLGQQHLQLFSLKFGAGYDLNISQGLRTWPEQAALWQLGRNPDGSYIDPIHQQGVVTHAQAGHSFHNYGLAYDIAISTPTGLTWELDDPYWRAAIAMGESLGLVAGAEWHGVERDGPHFQLTGGFGETPSDEVLYLFREGGLAAVWTALDTFYSSNPT